MDTLYYKLLPEISEFSTNAIPNPYKRIEIKVRTLCIFILDFLWMPLLFLCISPLHENRTVLLSWLCDSVIAISRFAQNLQINLLHEQSQNQPSHRLIFIINHMTGLNSKLTIYMVTFEINEAHTVIFEINP